MLAAMLYLITAIAGGLAAWIFIQSGLTAGTDIQLGFGAVLALLALLALARAAEIGQAGEALAQNRTAGERAAKAPGDA